MWSGIEARLQAALSARLVEKAQRVCRRPYQGHSLVLSFLEFGLRFTVIDNACARLDMKLAVTDLCGAQRDTGIKVTGCRNIADGAGIYAASVRLKLVDDLHGANFRCAGDNAWREAGDHRVYSVEAEPDFAAICEAICITWL